MTDSINVRLAVSACGECPVARLSSHTAIEDVRVDAAAERVEFVAPDPPEDPPGELDLVEFAGRAHGRYDPCCERAATDGGVVSAAPDSGADSTVSDEAGDPAVPEDGTDSGTSVPTAEPSACGDCSCRGLTAAFAGFPVSPRETWIEDGDLLVSFVLSGHEELTTVVDSFENAGLSVELRRLLVDREGVDTDDAVGSDVAPVDLSGVTDRQAEVAAVAAEAGYFEPDGASAAEIASELGLAKSTVSEHLRLVTASLFSQLFADGDGT